MLHSVAHGVDFNVEIESTVHWLLFWTVAEVMVIHSDSFVDSCIKKVR